MQIHDDRSSLLELARQIQHVRARSGGVRVLVTLERSLSGLGVRGQTPQKE
jgi:hypothetical protein